MAKDSDRPTNRPAEYSEVFTIIPPVSVKGNIYRDVSDDPIKQSSQTMELYNRWLELYHGLDDSDRFSLLELIDAFQDLTLNQKNATLKIVEEFYKSNKLRNK